MPRRRRTPRPAPDLPPHVERDLQRTIAVVIQVRLELAKQTKRLDQLEQELRLLVTGPELPLVPLSDRQVELLRYVALGDSNAEIADRLGLAPGSVSSLLTTTFRKLNARNRNEAMFTAWKLGLI